MSQKKNALKVPAAPLPATGQPDPSSSLSFFQACSAAGRQTAVLCRQKPFWALLFLEVFLAASLSVAYYFLVQTYSVGTQDNHTNLWVFSCCSLSDFHLVQLYDVWKGRLSSLLMSGWLFDLLIKGNTVQTDQYSGIFGLYQAVWLFLLFLTMILGLRKSLFINLGIFAGLMYNFSPASGMYFYPWDIPSTLFFTLAVLLFERKQMALMAAAAIAGCFFKETVLVCALLPLFAVHWRWWRRIALFAFIAATYILGKKFLLHHLNVQAAALSMNDSKNLAELLRPSILKENIRLFFSLNLNHVIFANGGTLVAVLILGWRRRFLPYMTVLLGFLAGQVMYGAFNEFRIFMQILPLSLILLSEWWQDYTRAAAAPADAPAPPAPASPWALRDTVPVLLVFGALLTVFSLAVPAWRYYTLVDYQQPDHQERVVAALETKAEKGSAADEYQLAQHYLKGEGVTANATLAFQWYQKAANQGYMDAEYQLGMRYAQAEGTARDYAASIPWFKKAADQGSADAEYNLGLLYNNGLGVKADLAEAAVWYQRAGEKGQVLAQNALGMLCFYLRKDYAEAMKWFQKAADQGNANAANSLGVLYNQGIGIKADPDAAQKWFKKAAELGLAEAQNNYGLMLFGQKNYAAAADALHKAADQGHAAGQYNIAQFYEQGIIYSKDAAEALLWYTRSASQGYALAEAKLGQFYHQGIGVRADQVEAYKWFKLATLQGAADAQSGLTNCAAGMTAAQIAAAEDEVKQSTNGAHQ